MRWVFKVRSLSFLGVFALGIGVALAATFSLSIPSQVIKVDTVFSSTSDFVAVFSDEGLTQPVLSLDFGEISDRGCGTKVPRVFVKNVSQISLSNLSVDSPLPTVSVFAQGQVPVFEAQSATQRANGTPYDGGAMAPGEVVTMFVWVCDTESPFMDSAPATIDDLELRLNVDSAEAP